MNNREEQRDSEKKAPKSFWETLPGMLAGIAALMTAVGGCIAILLTNPILVGFLFPSPVPPIATTLPPIATTLPPIPTTIILEASATLPAPVSPSSTAIVFESTPILPSSSTPAPTLIASNLPTITLRPGSGFIFESQKITSGMGVDRDVWWNGVELIPNYRMYSLGPVSNPQDIVEISPGNFSLGVFSPTIGEGFAIEVNRQTNPEYAIIRVLSVKEYDDITFEWLYPYSGP